MKTKNIRQSVTLNATQQEVYEALMNSRKHTKFTGSKASISRKIGGKFAVFNGEIYGKNLELKKNKKIVQSWRGSNWPKDHYSKATFNLKKVKNKTNLSFYQSGVPIRHYESIKKGWKDHYWNPMKEMFEK